MKGTPDTPRCGFSRTLVGLLQEEGISFESFDILEDQDVRQELKELSNWPTYPQVSYNNTYSRVFIFDWEGDGVLMLPSMLCLGWLFRCHAEWHLFPQQIVSLRSLFFMPLLVAPPYIHTYFQQISHPFPQLDGIDIAAVRARGAGGRPGHHQGDEARRGARSAAWNQTKGTYRTARAHRQHTTKADASSLLNNLAVT